MNAAPPAPSTRSRTLLDPRRGARELGGSAPPLRPDAPPASRGRHQRPAPLGLARLFGGFSTEDIRSQDLDDAQLRVGIVGATLTVTAFAGTDLASASPGTAHALVFPGLRKAEAQAVVPRLPGAGAGLAGEAPGARDLEELRAKSGGIQLAGAVLRLRRRRRRRPAPAARLRRAREMLQQGLMTDAEFEQVKSRILADL